MEYLIKIDRSTIRKNPDAGKNYQYIPGELNKEYDDQGNIIKAWFDVQRIYTLSSNQPYLFDYLPTTVVCDWCGHEMLHTDLEDYYDDISDIYSDTVCPKCSTLDCCTLKYEKLKI